MTNKDIEKMLNECDDKKELARKTGVHYFTILRWWNNKNAPSILKAQDVANAMGYDLRLVKRES